MSKVYKNIDESIILIQDNCLDALSTMSEQSINFIITSPPYADQRTSTYGGVKPENYVEWFLPIAEELYRVLKDDGSFVLNIKEKVVNGERHTYVIELVLALKKMGWLWTDEYIWHKKNSFPGFWKNRFRDAWEHCYHFTKNKQFVMNQKDVMVPAGDWKTKRFKKLSENDKIRHESTTSSGFGKNIQNWENRDMALPTNVLHFATECSNKKHPAAYPENLPEFFIKLFSNKGDIVLDPFVGSGTTLEVANRLGRKSIGVEVKEEYCISVSDMLKLSHEENN